MNGRILSLTLIVSLSAAASASVRGARFLRHPAVSRGPSAFRYAIRFDTDTHADPGRHFEASWPPESKHVAYSRSLGSHLRALFVYSPKGGKACQTTDGWADAITPAFDAGGNYFYHLARTDYGSKTGWFDMSSLNRPVSQQRTDSSVGPQPPEARPGALDLPLSTAKQHAVEELAGGPDHLQPGLPHQKIVDIVGNH